MADANLIVLVVEDEPLLLLAAVEMVENAGFEALEAISAAEALAILERRPEVRIVFTDIDMPPGLDGMQMAAMIRDQWPPVHLILTSGKYSRSQVTIPEGSMFFPKPYREKEVVAAFRRMAA